MRGLLEEILIGVITALVSLAVYPSGIYRECSGGDTGSAREASSTPISLNLDITYSVRIPSSLCWKIMSFQCEKCGTTFSKELGLRKHKVRKTPCDPILDKSDLPEDKRNNPHTCRYCGRAYSRKDNLLRHLKSCKIANSDEGMEKLMDHTIRRQLAEQSAKVDALQAQIAQLTTLLVSGTAPSSTAIMPAGASPQITNIGKAGVVNTGSITNVHVDIRPWSSEERIFIPVSLVKAAFTENPRLVEYCHFSDAECVNAEHAAPYVVEAIVELVKRAHAADPPSRNIYLNPKRADQVMVFDEAWTVLTLVETVRSLADTVTNRIRRIIVTDDERMQLPMNIQAAASYVPLMYQGEPEEYAKLAKAPLAAHLANMATLITAKP